jgi:hypothetical protein
MSLEEKALQNRSAEHQNITSLENDKIKNVEVKRGI